MRLLTYISNLKLIHYGYLFRVVYFEVLKYSELVKRCGWHYK